LNEILNNSLKPPNLAETVTATDFCRAAGLRMIELQ
jgi:hypothetical protein